MQSVTYAELRRFGWFFSTNSPNDTVSPESLSARLSINLSVVQIIEGIFITWFTVAAAAASSIWTRDFPFYDGTSLGFLQYNHFLPLQHYLLTSFLLAACQKRQVLLGCVYTRLNIANTVKRMGRYRISDDGAYGNSSSSHITTRRNRLLNFYIKPLIWLFYVNFPSPIQLLSFFITTTTSCSCSSIHYRESFQNFPIISH